MIVDVHTYIWDRPEQLGPAAAEALRGGPEEPWQRPDASEDAHRRATEAIGCAVVHSLCSTAAEARVDAERLAQWVRRRPGRLLGSVGIDPLARGYLAEVDRAVDLKFIGVTINPAAQGMHPMHTRATRLYERCQDRKLILFVHGLSRLAPRGQMNFGRPELLDEVAASFPNLRIVVGGLGRPWYEPTLSLLAMRANVYADVAGLAVHPWQLYNILLSAQRHNVLGKLLFGSGFPLGQPRETVAAIYSVNTLIHGTNLPGIARQHLQALVEHQAAAFLGLKMSAADMPAYSIEGDEDAILPPPLPGRM